MELPQLTPATEESKQLSADARFQGDLISEMSSSSTECNELTDFKGVGRLL